MKTISLCLLIVITTCSCNTRGQNPTTEQMMARADSIDEAVLAQKKYDDSIRYEDSISQMIWEEIDSAYDADYR